MIITEEQITERIIEFLYTCDQDDLAHIAGETFGGFCFPNSDEGYTYEFIPDENYYGAFDEELEK